MKDDMPKATSSRAGDGSRAQFPHGLGPVGIDVNKVLQLEAHTKGVEETSPAVEDGTSLPDSTHYYKVTGPEDVLATINRMKLGRLGALSPPFSVTLDAESREQAGIPLTAASFSFACVAPRLCGAV